MTRASFVSWTARVLAGSLAVLILGLPLACRAPEAPPTLEAVSPAELGRTVVPGVPLDLYLYLKQPEATVIPGGITGTANPTAVEALSLWGTATRGDYAFGGAFFFENTEAAAAAAADLVYAGRWLERDGRVVYFVEGAGAESQTLQTAILERRFRYYDDAAALGMIAALPPDMTGQLRAVLVGSPDATLSQYVDRAISLGDWRLQGMPFKLARIDTALAAIYAPAPLDIGTLQADFQAGNLFPSGFSAVLAAGSALPSFLVGPIMSQVLPVPGLNAEQQGGVTYYQASQAVYGETVYAAVRGQGNRLWAALASSEAQAAAMVTGIDSAS